MTPAYYTMAFSSSRRLDCTRATPACRIKKGSGVFLIVTESHLSNKMTADPFDVD